MAALGALQSLASGPAEAIPARLEEAFNALAEPERTRLGAGALERLVACLQDLGYNPESEFAQFIFDASLLGVVATVSKLPSTAGMRECATFRGFLQILSQQGVISRGDGDAIPTLDQHGARAGSEGNLVLARLLSASMSGDKGKVATLADELDPAVELRDLVRKAGLGEPLREMEPDNDLLREAANAKKGKRFIRTSEAKTEDVAKLKRPLAGVLLSTLPKLWAAVLQQRCSPGDALNWVAQVALVANDPSVQDQKLAEKASALYGARLFHEAYQVSKKGEDDTQGRQNVADALGTLDWGLAGRAVKELADTHDDAFRICLKGLFDKCTNRECKYAHRCPFHSGSREYAFQCFCADVSKQGWQLVKQDGAGKGAGSSKGGWRGKSDRGPVPSGRNEGFQRRDDKDRRSRSRSRQRY